MSRLQNGHRQRLLALLYCAPKLNPVAATGPTSASSRYRLIKPQFCPQFARQSGSDHFIRCRNMVAQAVIGQTGQAVVLYPL